MKFFAVIFLIIGIVIVLLYPLVNRERQCYDVSRKSLDDIAANVLNQRLTAEMECSASTDVLNDLETCIKEATKSSTIASYANDTVQRIVAIVRPYGKNLWTLKEEHNLTCADYSWYQLP